VTLAKSIFSHNVTQRLRLQLYDLNYGAIQIILLTYLLTGGTKTSYDNVRIR